MNNLNIFETTLAGFRQTNYWKLSQDKPNNCPGNCSAQIDGDFWLQNQHYWVYKCACCQTRQIEKASPAVYEWGGIYD